MNKFLKSAVVVSSLALAGALIAYEGGYIPLGFPAFGQAQAPAGQAQSAPSVMLSGSKSDVFVTPPPGSQAATSQPVMMFSSKSAAISAPPQPAQSAPTVILPSSKSFIVTTPGTGTAPVAPSSTGAAPAVILGGSKSLILTPAPATATAPASQPAQKGGGR